MLRFNLGPISVEVRFGHLVMAAAIALTGLPKQLSAASNAPLAVAYVASVMAVIFLSVLVHELGHALVSLAFGYRPAIQLVWTGGLTRPNAPAAIPWHRDILLTLAGPAFGILLGLGFFALRPMAPNSGLVRDFFDTALGINIGWSVLNLLPVLPLDGGRISSAFLIRLFGRRGFLVAQLVGLTVSGGVVLAFLLLGASSNYLVFLFALLAMRSVAQIAAYFRGEPVPGLEHPAERDLALARTSFSQGELDAARRQVDSLLQQVDLPSALRSRAHHLLGWIDIKEGQGRAALDQFSQVQGQAVEPQALAAAFALIGDETRSASLWEIAYRRTGDRTVLHEWAGTLIRAGRLEEAKKLPDVDLASAFMCAQRVFFIRGHYSEAAQVGLTALGLSPRAQIAYDTACALARAGDVSGALRTLEKAAELGFTNADFAASDADLAPLHARPEFHSWIQRLRQTEAS